jgi:D-aminopeptidase
MPLFADESLIPPGQRKSPIGWSPCSESASKFEQKDGSIIVVIATDAPLLPHQLRRLAKRPSLALGRLGGVGSNTSGDIFIAFSTANARALEAQDPQSAPIEVTMHPNSGMTSLFEATIDATEEAILNALVAATSSEGANGLRISRLPHQRVCDLLSEHNLLGKS